MEEEMIPAATKFAIWFLVLVIEFRMWIGGKNRRTDVTEDLDGEIFNLLRKDLGDRLQKTETPGLYRCGSYLLSTYDKTFSIFDTEIKFRTLSPAVTIFRASTASIYRIKIDSRIDIVDEAERALGIE